MTVAPLGVNRAGSVEAVNRALAGDRMVLLLLQRGTAEEPAPDDLHRVGTVAIIRQMAKGPNGIRVLVEGVARARAEFLQTDKGFLKALLKPLPESTERSIDIDARVRRLQELVDRALSLATGLSPEVKTLVMSLDDPLRIVPPRQPARHEGRGQAAAARGEQPVDQARRGLDGAVSRNRGARTRRARSNRARKRK